MAAKFPSSIGPQELARRLGGSNTIRLLDVRTPAEFERAHVAGSYNLPLAELHRHAESLSAARAPIVLICRSGARARAAEDTLRRACVSTVSVLDGGILAWRRHGLPVLGAPVTRGVIVRRIVGVAGLALGALAFRENPFLGFAIAFVGLRLTLGQSVLPCAVNGSCAVSPDFGATAAALVAGRPAADAEQGQMPIAG